MSLSDRDLERLERQSERARRDPGTDRTGITRVKATVDTGGAHGEEVEVNGHKARNLSGVALAAGDVCFVELWDGKRAVFSAFRGPSSGSNSSGEWHVGPTGLLTCLHTLTVPGGSTSGVSWTFPRQFDTAPHVTATQDVSSSEVAVVTGVATGSCVVRVRELSDASIGATSRDVSLMAVGPDS